MQNRNFTFLELLSKCCCRKLPAWDILQCPGDSENLEGSFTTSFIAHMFNPCGLSTRHVKNHRTDVPHDLPTTQCQAEKFPANFWCMSAWSDATSDETNTRNICSLSHFWIAIVLCSRAKRILDTPPEILLAVSEGWNHQWLPMFQNAQIDAQCSSARFTTESLGACQRSNDWSGWMTCVIDRVEQVFLWELERYLQLAHLLNV